MRILDVHSHWGTRRGYPLRDEASLKLQRHTFASDAQFHSEEEMAAYLRQNNVRTILDFGFTKSMSIDEVRPFHDYAIETQKTYPDAILGNWVQLDPRTGADGARELRRCIEASAGFIGCCVSAAGMGYPASHEIYKPFYDVCAEYERPALVLVGYTGAGAGKRGGGGLKLDLCHPRYVDELAADRPELDIIAGRPAWPWQDEMIAVMLHKANVWAEMHGWSPKYFTDALKHDIPRRLRKRIMFGADYPLLRYERLAKDWQDLGYGEDVLADVFHGNAERLFGLGSREARQSN
ncbi:MAG: amidohydrolase family protein [Lautropia sp.]